MPSPVPPLDRAALHSLKMPPARAGFDLARWQATVERLKENERRLNDLRRRLPKITLGRRPSSEGKAASEGDSDDDAPEWLKEAARLAPSPAGPE